MYKLRIEGEFLWDFPGLCVQEFASVGDVFKELEHIERVYPTASIEVIDEFGDVFWSNAAG
jgi:hypothetical protein